MINRDRYHVEVAGPIATVYIVAHLSWSFAKSLLAECDALPASVRKLRVSFADPYLIADSLPELIDELRERWQSTRAGTFLVSSAELPSTRKRIRYGTPIADECFGEAS